MGQVKQVKDSCNAINEEIIFSFSEQVGYVNNTCDDINEEISLLFSGRVVRVRNTSNDSIAETQRSLPSPDNYYAL